MPILIKILNPNIKILNKSKYQSKI